MNRQLLINSAMNLKLGEGFNISDPIQKALIGFRRLKMFDNDKLFIGRFGNYPVMSIPFEDAIEDIESFIDYLEDEFNINYDNSSLLDIEAW